MASERDRFVPDWYADSDRQRAECVEHFFRQSACERDGNRSVCGGCHRRSARALLQPESIRTVGHVRNRDARTVSAECSRRRNLQYRLLALQELPLPRAADGAASRRGIQPGQPSILERTWHDRERSRQFRDCKHQGKPAAYSPTRAEAHLLVASIPKTEHRLPPREG